MGDGGNITISSDLLSVTNGSQIRALSKGSGDSGNITIRAREIFIGGLDKVVDDSSSPRPSGFFTNSEKTSGGNIDVSADNITLDTGRISALSFGNSGGDVNIISKNLEIFNNSLISASSFGENFDSNGGDVDIDVDALLAINDSDITATSVRGSGGNITIKTSGLLGIQEGEAIKDNGVSEIDASSKFGTDGIVTFINPQSNFANPLIAMKEIQINEQKQENNNNCWSKSFDHRNLKLIYTGRGGFPETPNNFNDEKYIAAPNSTIKTENNFPWLPGDPVIQANTVRTDRKGDIYLVAELSPQNTEFSTCRIKIKDFQSN